MSGIVSANAWLEWRVGAGMVYSVESEVAVCRWRSNSVFNA